MRAIKELLLLTFLLFNVNIYADEIVYSTTFTPICTSSSSCRLEITNLSDKDITFYSPYSLLPGTNTSGTIKPGQTVQTPFSWTQISWEDCKSWGVHQGPLAVYYGDDAWQVDIKTGCGVKKTNQKYNIEYVDFWIGLIYPELTGRCIKGTCGNHTLTGNTSQSDSVRVDNNGLPYYDILSFIFK